MLPVNKSFGLVAASLLLGCALFDFTTMDVTTSPAENGALLAQGQYPSVQFSLLPLLSSAESAVSLLKDEVPVKCDFQWQGKTVELHPLTPLAPGTRYQLKVGGNLVLPDGRQFFASKVVNFVYGQGPSPLTLQTATPASGSFLGLTTPVVLIFNQSVDPTSLTAGFSLTPQTDYQAVWSTTTQAQDTLTLTPRSQWSSLNLYKLELTKKLLSASGQSLLGETSLWFQVQADQTPPTLVSGPDFLLPVNYTSTGLPNPGYQDVLSLSFSEAIDPVSLESSVQFFPPVTGHWETPAAGQFLFLPTSGWEMATDYTLSLKPAVKDLSGLPLASEWSANFSTTATIPLQTVAAQFQCLDSGGQVSTVSPPSGNETSPGQVTFGNANQTMNVTLTFGQDIPTSYLTQLASNTPLTVVYPLSANQPLLKNLARLSSKSVQFSYTLAPPPVGTTWYYKLVLPGGKDLTVNALGSYLKTETVFFLKVVGG